jgi:hypothetical protein
MKRVPRETLKDLKKVKRRLLEEVHDLSLMAFHCDLQHERLCVQILGI